VVSNSQLRIAYLLYLLEELPKASTTEALDCGDLPYRMRSSRLVSS